MMPKQTNFRWVVLALLFLAITINYIDRVVMSILGPFLREMYQISGTQYGNIQAAFAIAYAGGQLVCGAWLDRVGPRIGYAVSLAAWSVVSALHATVSTALGFGFMRACLGVTEAPAFPAGVKTIAEWFPKRERALAMGVFNSGLALGAILAPWIVPWVARTFGWQWAFIGTGLVGMIWLVLWLPLYRRPQDHPRVSAEELAYINSDPSEPTARLPWVTLLTYRPAQAFALSKFLTDSMWWFYMSWLPDFFHTRFGLDLRTIGLPLMVIYGLAATGSIFGGGLSSGLLARGYSLNFARKTALLLCALGVMPIVLAAHAGLWTSVVLLGLAMAAHQDSPPTSTPWCPILSPSAPWVRWPAWAAPSATSAPACSPAPPATSWRKPARTIRFFLSSPVQLTWWPSPSSTCWSRALRPSARLLVVRPHADNLNRMLVLINLIHQTMLKIDAPRISPGQISYQLFIRRWILKWVGSENRQEFLHRQLKIR